MGLQRQQQQQNNNPNENHKWHHSYQLEAEQSRGQSWGELVSASTEPGLPGTPCSSAALAWDTPLSLPPPFLPCVTQPAPGVTQMEASVGLCSGLVEGGTPEAITCFRKNQGSPESQSILLDARCPHKPNCCVFSLCMACPFSSWKSRVVRMGRRWLVG